MSKFFKCYLKNKHILFMLLSIFPPLILFLILGLANGSKAETWEKVVNDGFDSLRNDYAWSMETFQGKLYVGTLNPRDGAEIWCSENGDPDSWKKVYNGRSLSNLGIRCLYNDGDKVLYAGTLNNRGAQILKSTDGERWIPVARRGFGDTNNTNVRCIARYKGYLYAGIGSNGAKLYRSVNGTSWEEVTTNPSFEDTTVLDPETDTMVINNVMIGELMAFKDYLYAFTWSMDIDYKQIREIFDDNSVPDLSMPLFNDSPGAFEVYRSQDGINWEKVVGKDDAFGNGLGFCNHNPENMDNDAVTSVTVFKGGLYLGTENYWKKSSVWKTDNGTSWEKVLDFFELGEEYNYYVWRMINFKDRLFVGTMNLGPTEDEGVTGAQIWVSDSGETGSFYNMVNNGFDGESIYLMKQRIPKNVGIRSFCIFDNNLYAGTATLLGTYVTREGRSGRPVPDQNGGAGCEVWRLIQ